MNSLFFQHFRASARPVRNALLWASVFAASAVMAQGAVEVGVAPAQLKSVAAGFELDGAVQPVKQSTISAQASGRVATLLVKAGDKVRAGQLLATIDDRETQTGVQRSLAQSAQAQAELRNAQANFDRTRDLQQKGFVSKAALDTADSQLKGAQAGRDQATAGARQSALAQGFTRVTAPFEGWVQQTHVEAGDLAVPGKPLLTLYAPTPLRALVQVPVSRAGLARSADAVEVLVQFGAAGPKWIRPVASSTVPSADAVSQTIEWRLELPPEVNKVMLPGQQVRVRFVGQQIERLVVPASAVLRRGELTAVYAVADKGFALRAVRVGADHGADGVEIVAGLMRGERVALDPIKAGLAGARVGAAQ